MTNDQIHQFKDRIYTARDSVFSHFSGSIDQAVILGSGLSGLTLAGFDSIAKIGYADIVGLPRSTAPSHKGELELVSDGKHIVALCSGRQHLYEGYTAQEVCTLIYTLSLLGTKRLVVTNAAGALNPDYRPGDVMVIDDHINLTGHNPIIGQDEEFGITFPDMSQAYPESLREELQEAADLINVKVHQGVYVGVTGPSLETSAERRMFRSMGGDAIGMSTVLEVIAANHVGMRVMGVSAITNMAMGDANQQPDTIEDVLKHAAVAGAKIKSLLERTLIETKA